MGVKANITQALGRDAPYVSVLPVPTLANRAPMASDILPAGALFIDESVTPHVVYISLGNGTFSTGAFAGLSANGTINLNTSGSGVTTIGTGGTGAVNIGNATGNTTVTGALNVTGDITTSTGNVVISGAAKQLQVEGGAVTDFIGRATLVAGTVTVACTGISASDRIFVTRSALNASPALGFPITTISAGASFTIASYDATGVAAITDVSTFDYFIVRQL